jgi:hypothetical protein
MLLIKELAFAHRDLTVVVRPHPSESVEFYDAAFTSFPNVEVRRDRGVMDWIRDASLVVHCKCTTGIEAVLAQRPVLHYWPDQERDSDGGHLVAREAGVTVNDIDQALRVGSELMGAPPPSQVWSPLALTVLNNLSTPAIPLLVEETIGIIGEFGLDASDFRPPAARRRGWPKLRIRPKKESQGYVASKRGPFDRIMVENLVAACTRNGVGEAAIAGFSERFVVLEPT